MNGTDAPTPSQDLESESTTGQVRSRLRSRSRWIVMLLVAALAAAGGYGVVQTVSGDFDGDGLSNRTEWYGWTTEDGSEYKTDANKADTDDDGLSDGEEAGALVADGDAANTYVGYANPLLTDSDDDGLSDAEEADLSLEPRNSDTDDDGLSDGQEVQIVGSAPDLADTDGDGFNDGFEDANRESKGLDPLWVDVKVSKLTYATDFAQGAVAGDFLRDDSLAWLAGNLTSGATSSIPVIGSVVGGVTDVRDAIGSAIQADWVGAGFSAVGAVPGGDVVAIPGKAAKFVARNPELAAAVAAMIAVSLKVPDTIKIRAAREVWGPRWTELTDAGVSEKALLRLIKGRTNLNDYAKSLQRRGHVTGPSAKPFSSGPEGEKYLEGLHPSAAGGSVAQVRFRTRTCLAGVPTSVRIVDVLSDGVAREAKVGYARLTPFLEKQIRKDACLIKSGDVKAAHWHFFASSRSNTVGADPKVYDLLEEFGIPYTIHAPA